MLEFWIADLLLDEQSFQVPSVLGQWEFERAGDYDEKVLSLNQGMCANTFFASNAAIGLRTRDEDFKTVCDEMIDICCVLSFLTARCVTPTGTTRASHIPFLQLGDDFIRARSIQGFAAIATPSMTTLFSQWLTRSYRPYKQHKMRLQLTHWLSGLTCFSLEDLYLSVGVQMDLVKQCEIATIKRRLTYFKGMTSAASRYGLTPLGTDYKEMRNDMVHEGVLSGTNFAGRSKADCAQVTANTLNWLDQYVLAVLGLSGQIAGLPRWNGNTLAAGLPAITVR